MMKCLIVISYTNMTLYKLKHDIHAVGIMPNSILVHCKNKMLKELLRQ